MDLFFETRDSFKGWVCEALNLDNLSTLAKQVRSGDVAPLPASVFSAVVVMTVVLSIYAKKTIQRQRRPTWLRSRSPDPEKPTASVQRPGKGPNAADREPGSEQHPTSRWRCLDADSNSSMAASRLQAARSGAISRLVCDRDTATAISSLPPWPCLQHYDGTSQHAMG